MSSDERWDRLAERAAARLGYFTPSDAEEAGLSTSALRWGAGEGRCRHVRRGLYEMAGVPASRERDVLAACLVCGPDALASHRTAAALHSLRGMAPKGIEVTTPRELKVPGIRTHRASDLCGMDRDARGPVPVTSVVRTLLDLAAAGIDERRFEMATDEAVRRGLLTIVRLRHRFDHWEPGRRRGVVIVRRYLERRDHSASVTDSELEQLFLDIIREYRLPEPVRQQRVLNRRPSRTDFAYVGPRIVIELDGSHHATPAQWIDDLDRQNDIIVAGWRVLRFTRFDVMRRREYVARTVADALGFPLPAAAAR